MAFFNLVVCVCVMFCCLNDTLLFHEFCSISLIFSHTFRKSDLLHLSQSVCYRRHITINKLSASLSKTCPSFNLFVH